VPVFAAGPCPISQRFRHIAFGRRDQRLEVELTNALGRVSGKRQRLLEIGKPLIKRHAVAPQSVMAWIKPSGHRRSTGRADLVGSEVPMEGRAARSDALDVAGMRDAS
jgi:hypothetical protein